MKNQKKLSNSKLIAYSAAAGAALAVAPNAFAAIVHETDGRSFGDGHTAGIDLTMEGKNAEFKLFGQSLFNPDWSTTYFTINIYRKYNGPLVFGDGEIVWPITTSADIGQGDYIPNIAEGTFYFGSKSTGGSTHTGYWTDGNERYCGVSFYKDDGSGVEVYGWIKIQRLTKGSGKIIDWAYETTGASIPAGYTGPVPEPATGLALLALGAAGIAAYRRR